MRMKLEEDRREREFWEKPGTKTQPCLLATAVLTNGAPQIALYFRKGFLERPQATKLFVLEIRAAANDVPRLISASSQRCQAGATLLFPISFLWQKYPVSLSARVRYQLQAGIKLLYWNSLKIRAIFLFLVTDTIQRLFKRLRNQTRCPIRREMGE